MGRPVVAEELNNYNNQIEPIRIGRDLAARRNQAAVDLNAEEPERRLLSEPPVGYRRPAGTAALGQPLRNPFLEVFDRNGSDAELDEIEGHAD